MDELIEYRQRLLSEIRECSIENELSDQDAFFDVTCNILKDNDIISDFAPAHYQFGAGSNRFTLVDGYDQSSFDQDESMVLIACDTNFSLRMNIDMPTIQGADYKRYAMAMKRFIVSALKGRFQKEAEESTEAYALASYIYEHRDSIHRFRLYFITDRKFTGRDATASGYNDLYSKSKQDDGMHIEAHFWDLRRLMEASLFSRDAENLIIRFEGDGVQAVKSPDQDTQMETYLLFLTGDKLADMYQQYGSKLMESNVRSFLSMRGKINKGIKKTIETEPDRFVAFNNGLTATSTSIELNEQGNITSIENLQIVNGGQTTASIYYTSTVSSVDLSKVVVPVKLVVVNEDVAKELVPSISRFTNSQNKVAEADFSANSEYQIKLEHVARSILTPPIAGNLETHWYYERVRGQYESERNRIEPASLRRRFDKVNPKNQRIKMVDATKYLMCWSGFPYIASLGAQKCFAKFADESSQDASIVDKVDKDYYKQLVCKRIIFDAVYKHIKKAPWYAGAYQMNIASYAMAKYAYDIEAAGETCDFDEVWRMQEVSPQMLGCLMQAAEQASSVINAADRPTNNPSEWAKKEKCWRQLQELPSTLQANPLFECTEDLNAEDDWLGGSISIDDVAVGLPDSQGTATVHMSPAASSTYQTVSPLETPIGRRRKAHITFVDDPSDLDEQREYLMRITPQQWRDFMQWGSMRAFFDNRQKALLSKVERAISLTDEETSALWKMRKRAFIMHCPKMMLSVRADK